MNAPDHDWIATPEDLPRVAEALASAPWIALDTESNSMFVYRERVCLVQINAGGRIFVVDTLALSAAASAALRGPLEDPARPKWLHGGEYDVACLKRDFGIAVRGARDSQQAASLLGWEATGYGAVVERVCGVKLSKSHTQYDWGTRPLAPEALRYAIDDVVYLPRVAEALSEEIRAKDLEEEWSIANEAVMATQTSLGFDPVNIWKVKGIRDIPAKALPVAFALFVWRDGVAAAANQPPGRLLNNEAMLAVARQAPTNFPQLKQIGLRSWFLAEHGEALIETVKRALSQPDPLPDRPRQREVDDAERRREIRLKDWRRVESERRAVPMQVVLPAKALEFLKQHGAAGDLAAVPQLGAKRAKLYGDKLRELCS